MRINEDIVYYLSQTPISLLEEISKYENKDIDHNNLKQIKKIKEEIPNIKHNIDIQDIVSLLSKLNTKEISNFIIDIDKADKSFLNELLFILESLEGKKNTEASFLIEKLLKIYRINLLTTVFSKNRMQALELALRNYK